MFHVTNIQHFCTPINYTYSILFQILYLYLLINILINCILTIYKNNYKIKLKTTKLINLIKLLSKKEAKIFLGFCKTDIVYVRQGVIELVEYLLLLHPNYNEENTNEKLIYKKAFGATRFNRAKLTILFTSTTKALEAFLATHQLLKWEFDSARFLTAELLDRTDDSIAEGYIKSIEKMNSKGIIHDSEYYNHLYQTEELIYLNTSKHKGYSSNLQQLTTQLDLFYYTRKIKYYCEMLNQQSVLQMNFDLTNIQTFLSTVEKTIHIEKAAISVYAAILKMLLAPAEDQKYAALKEKIYTHQQEFSGNEKRNLFTYLQNYCIRKINTGITPYLQELFNNYEFMLQKEIITEGGVISQFDFKNIITISLRLKKYDWTETFLQQYSPMIDAKDRENAIDYNRSRVLYTKGDYKSALRIMQRVTFSRIFYQIDAKILLLKIYYDINDEDGLLNAVNAFKIFLKRNKEISKYQYQSNYNFCTYLLMLNKIKNGSKKVAPKLKEKLKLNRQVIDITWLEERLGFLE